jgi:hypothetical protein
VPWTVAEILLIIRLPRVALKTALRGVLGDFPQPDLLPGNPCSRCRVAKVAACRLPNGTSCSRCNRALSSSNFTPCLPMDQANHTIRFRNRFICRAALGHISYLRSDA